MSSSVEPSQSPKGILTPSVVIPRATMLVRPFKSIPSSIITANLTSSKRRAISSASDTADFDVDLAARSTAAPTGSCVRR